MNSVKSAAGVIALSVILPLSANAGDAGYTVTDLGTLGGTFSQPFATNKSGVVAGGATLADGTQHAVLWSSGQATDLGTLGGPNSFAGGVNANTVASGAAENQYSDPNGEDFCGFGTHMECLPFVWQSGTMSALPTLGGNNGTALRNNSSGVTAGYAETSTPDTSCPAPQVLQFEPAVWTGGSVQALPTVGKDKDGIAMGINDYNDVVGASGKCAAFNQNTGLAIQARHALLWQNGVATDLGNLGGKTGAAMGNIAWAINNNSQVVGVSDLAGDTTFHAFLWQDDAMSDLGTLPGDVDSVAISINDNGVILGLSIDSNFNTRAVIWKGGRIHDLNKLAQNSPLYLLTGCSIDKKGAITGLGLTNSGDIHAYLATPIR
jgi:probable HAF family extracellular repeat protein